MTYIGMQPRLAAGLVIVTTLTGCPDRATETADTSGSTTATGSSDGTATTDDPTGPTPTTGEPFDGVIVTREDIYLPAEGASVPLAADPLGPLTALTVLVGDAVFSGEYDGAGRRLFADVPPGPFIIREEFKPSVALPGAEPFLLFTATDVRTFDRGAARSGRPDPTLTEATGTAVTVDVGDMRPLQLGDTFELYSYDIDVQGYYQSTWDPDAPDPSQPAEGALALAGWKLAWDATTIATGRDAVPLLDPGKGDTLWLDHLVHAPFVADIVDFDDPWSYASFTWLAEAATLTVPALTAGTSVAATGTFVAVPKKTAKLDLRLSQFSIESEQLAGGVSDQFFCEVSLYLEPGIDTPVVGMVPTLATLSVQNLETYVDPLCAPDEFGECFADNCPNGCNYETIITRPGDRVVELAYGNPYPHGTETIGVQCVSRVLTSHPTQMTSESLFSRITVSRRLADAGPLAPTLSPPRNLRLDGELAPATADVATVGPTPTLTFDPPTLGEPDYYAVSIRTLEDLKNGDEILSSRRTIATVRTTDTTVQIPAGVLVPGAYYTLEVTARSGAALTAPSRPLTHDLADASTSSRIFTP